MVWTTSKVLLLLVMTANIVRFTRFPLSDNGVQCTRMIFDIQPVTDLIAFTVNWQSFTVQRIQDNQRDQFFREMVRTVVV
jgi:hypothetical protein